MRVGIINLFFIKYLQTYIHMDMAKHMKKKSGITD